MPGIAPGFVTWAVFGIIAGGPPVHAEEAPPPKVAAGEEWRETVQQFAARYFRHPAWGYSQSTRDYELAKRRRVLSPAGRALAPRRVAETQQFLETLRQESDDLRNL